MSSRTSPSIALLAVVSACSATPRAVTSANAPDSSARAQALADVARLAAQADKDPLLAPWTGPYRGVPPWDKVTAAAFPLRSPDVNALLKKRGFPVTR